MTDLFEELSAIQHDIWASWQRYVHDNKTVATSQYEATQGRIINQDDFERWQKQIDTPYAELTEKEKDGDREQVNKFWHLIESMVERVKELENYQLSVRAIAEVYQGNKDVPVTVVDLKNKNVEQAGQIKELEKEYKGLTFDYDHLLNFVVTKGLGSEFDKFKV